MALSRPVGIEGPGPVFLTKWAALADELGLSDEASRDIGFDLAACHTEPHRHYHTMSHVEAVLEHLEALHAASPTARLAAFFHDAIYDPTRGDNEAQSAQLAREVLDAVELAEAADVATIVTATASHELVAGTPRDTAAFLDADLAILAAPAHVYDTYVTNIRAEYAHVSDADFAVGRRAVLERFLTRDALYFTGAGRLRFEIAARANLRRELDTLR